MKKRAILLLLCVPLAAGLFMWFAASRSAKKFLIQGRSVDDWVRDVQVGGYLGETNVALEVLISAGPRIMPDLSHLLLAFESPKDIAMRLPSRLVPTGTKDHHAIESEVLVLKAKVATVLGAIAFRHPDTPEVLASIPPLTTALRSGSREVRALSAQALGAIGRGASNAIPALIAKTTDEESGVKMSAVEALGHIGMNTRAVIEALTKAASDTNRDVNVTAKQALQMLQGAPPNAESVK